MPLPAFAIPLITSAVSTATNLGMHYGQRAYNKPSRQLRRLKKAGLNPNIVYADGIQNTYEQSTPQLPSDLGIGEAAEKIGRGSDSLTEAANSKDMRKFWHSLRESGERPIVDKEGNIIGIEAAYTSNYARKNYLEMEGQDIGNQSMEVRIADTKANTKRTLGLIMNDQLTANKMINETKLLKLSAQEKRAALSYVYQIKEKELEKITNEASLIALQLSIAEDQNAVMQAAIDSLRNREGKISPAKAWTYIIASGTASLIKPR